MVYSLILAVSFVELVCLAILGNIPIPSSEKACGSWHIQPLHHLWTHIVLIDEYRL